MKHLTRQNMCAIIKSEQVFCYQIERLLKFTLIGKEFVVNVGMLWFDNDPRTALVAKVNRAADFYRQKYGLNPNMCLVNPSMLGGQSELVDNRAGNVAVLPNRTIQPGHFWIGIEEKN
jgi:hypothetical protein